MKTKFLLIILLTIAIHANAVMTYTWTQETNFGGTGRNAAAGFSIGTAGYIGTGVTAGGNVKDFWKWDQPTNAWTQIADFGGTARSAAAHFAIDSNGYVGMGTNASATVFYSDFWEYDPVSNTWTQKAVFAGGAREGGACFVIGTTAYYGTGYDGSNLLDFWKWDQTTNVWTQIADFAGTARRDDDDGFAIGNKGYVGTGFNGSTYLNDFWEYDPVADKWTQKADFAGAGRQLANGFSIGNYGYIGLGNNAQRLNDFWKYDPVSDMWTAEPNFGGTARTFPAGFVIECYAYIGTGTTDSGLATDFWQFYDSTNTCSLLPMASFESGDSTICTFGCINFTDLSTNATSWQWSFQGASDSTSTAQNPQNICYEKAGVYNVTLIASNATGSNTINVSNYITVNAAPPTPVITQHDDTLFCSTDTSYSSYQWYSDTTMIIGATETFFVFNFNGNYNVRVTNKNGCLISAGINITTGINEFSANNYISLYPNPATNQLTIHTSSFYNEQVMVSVVDLLGQETSAPKDLTPTLSKGEGDAVIDVSDLPAGMYFLQLKTESRSVVKRFVKE